MWRYILLIAVFKSHVSRAETAGSSCNETQPCPLIGEYGDRCSSTICLRVVVIYMVPVILNCGKVMTTSTSFLGGQPLQRCPELVSEGGHLNTVLRVQTGVYDFDWLRLVRRTYNGLTCSHTWRVKPGDTINVTLVSPFSHT